MPLARKILLLILIAALALCAACSGGGGFTLDKDKAAAEIQSKVSFGDSLALVPKDYIAIHYPNLESVSDDFAVYMTSTGLTTEEFAIAKAKNGSTANDVKIQLEKRIEEQRFRYEIYLPEQVAKLDSAVIKTKGDWAVLIICENSSEAEAVLKDILK